MLVEPGFFRTELLSPESTNYAQPSIDDYAERTTQTVAAWTAMNGQQGGDPAKLANALDPAGKPGRAAAALGGRRRRRRHGRAQANDLLAQADASRKLSSSLAYGDDAADHSATERSGSSTFATVRLRQRVTKGPGSRAAGVAMAFKLIESASNGGVPSTHPTSSLSSGPSPVREGPPGRRPDESGGDQQVA